MKVTVEGLEELFEDFRAIAKKEFTYEPEGFDSFFYRYGDQSHYAPLREPWNFFSDTLRKKLERIGWKTVNPIECRILIRLSLVL